MNHRLLTLAWELVRFSIPLASGFIGYYYGDTLLNSLVSFFG